MNGGLTIEMLGLLAPAFFAGLVVASIHVPLGQEVLKRGIIFIDLAIAQIAALGVVVCNVFFHVEGGILPFALALLFAMAGSGFFAWLERAAPKYQEAFIGCSFVISASLIILILSHDPHGGEEMQGLLSGQILWVGWTQVMWTGLVYTGLLAAWFVMKAQRARLFFIIFPVMITMSVQLVGVYLVFASLIMPALATAFMQGNNKLWTGYGIAALSFAGGLTASTLFDMPAGPAIVCCYPLVSLCLILFMARTAR